MIGSGQQTVPSGACARARHRAQVQPFADLLPGNAAIGGNKNAAIALVVDDARKIRAGFRGPPAAPRPCAPKSPHSRLQSSPTHPCSQHPAAIGRQQHMIRIAGIDKHVVHNHIRPGHALENSCRRPRSCRAPRWFRHTPPGFTGSCFSTRVRRAVEGMPWILWNSSPRSRSCRFRCTRSGRRCFGWAGST
jgi:hypothetical protein